MESYVYYIGMVSSILLAITPFAQVISTIRSKSAQGLSLYFMVLQIIASTGFMIYGILLSNIWIILPNTSLVFTNIILIILKYYFDPPNCYKKNILPV